MAREDDNFYDDPYYGGGAKDYSADNVPRDPNEGNYSDEVPDLPQEEIDADEARESVLRNEGRHTAPSIGGLRGGLGDAAAKRLIEKAPGGKKATETAKKAEEAVRFSQNLVSDAKNFGAAAKSVGTFFANPWVLIATAVVVVIILCIISITALAQVYGQTKTSVEGGASYSAGAMQQRLAQRAEWLQQNVTNYSESGALTGSAPSPKGGLSSNAWLAACPQIVQIIYGLSPFLTGYMGANNAYFNYRAHPDMYEAWSFSSGTGNFGAYGDGTSSPGASLQNPPPGAIVSIENQPAWYNTCCPGAGHTFVMLTDELVIDNWSSGGVTLGNPGAGPRILDDGMRGHIVGWALPKSEGFEGSFITGSFEGMAPDAPNQSPMPGLPPVPTYMGDVVAPGGGGGGNFTGDAQHAAWMKAAGIAEGDWNYVDYIATRESSWNPKATNAESGACGLIQALPCSKVPGNGYDPVDNLRWANSYAKDRYGSWQAAHQFWQANHWW